MSFAPIIIIILTTYQSGICFFLSFLFISSYTYSICMLLLRMSLNIFFGIENSTLKSFGDNERSNTKWKISIYAMACVWKNPFWGHTRHNCTMFLFWNRNATFVGVCVCVCENKCNPRLSRLKWTHKNKNNNKKNKDDKWKKSRQSLLFVFVIVVDDDDYFPTCVAFQSYTHTCSSVQFLADYSRKIYRTQTNSTELSN